MTTAADGARGPAAIADRFRRVRARTCALAAPLSAEDAMVQSMPDASPTKWHLAHTTWFFDEFVLGPAGEPHTWEDPRWRILYNSYYEAAGPRHPRAARGQVSRPLLHEVDAWRSRTDDAVLALVGRAEDAALAAIELGVHHEEQHQELLLTDAKHALYGSPLRPAYWLACSPGKTASRPAPAMAFHPFEESMVEIGAGEAPFAFDNERPRHRALVPAFLLGSRLVTNGEFAAFVEDGGYRRPEWWLSEGFGLVQSTSMAAPLYWERDGASWSVFGMSGMVPLDPTAPVIHVSYYEADAYARWAGARLPTEFEWEKVAALECVRGSFVDSEAFAPAAVAPSADASAPLQLFGEAWQWTSSAYAAYPRFRALPGALGEYNGKFMSGQMVLRGGSCFSSREHLRATYRNFFPPSARWQVTGIRLAKDG